MNLSMTRSFQNEPSALQAVDHDRVIFVALVARIELVEDSGANPLLSSLSKSVSATYAACKRSW